MHYIRKNQKYLSLDYFL